jgi:lysophospholipase L1-like esterase
MESELLDRLLHPFWLSNRIEQESVLFVQDSDDPPDALLLFTPSQIMEVRSATLETRYFEGQDWICQGTRLVLLPGSGLFHFHRSELRPLAAPAGAGIFPGRDRQAGVLFAEGGYFHQRQAVVTYTHSGPAWDGPCPRFQGSLLPRSLNHLQQEHRLKLVLFGDSISVGANASSLSGVPPFLPTWGELVKLKLEDRYKARIEYDNPSEGGRDSIWGLAEIEQRVAAREPDLVILAFGMNDGTAGLEASAFHANLVAMMEVVRRGNPAVEFLLVAPMLANPESLFNWRQSEYGAVIQSLARSGTAAIDMGQFHAALLRHKRYVDLTGNNINHPNDFLSRCYAMAVLSTLIDSETGGAA